MNKTNLILVVLFLLVIHGCNQEVIKNHELKRMPFRDSVLKEYLFYTDSLMRSDNSFVYIDSLDYNYRLLQSYYYNDSSSLSEYLKTIALARESRIKEDTSDHVPFIRKMNIDKAYQFDYNSTFCPYAFNITVSKKRNIIVSHVIVYEQKELNEKFKIAKEYDKELTETNWEDFVSAIEFADFWQLKPQGELGCCDGDFLTVDAVIRQPDDLRVLKSNRVRRQFVKKTALYNAFKLLCRFSAITEKCE